MVKLIVVAGPTASGKTAVAITLSKLVGGEIISADSMQVYKLMDIGTAKPTQEEREGIAHHMIDVVMPDEDFSVAKYQAQARAAISDVLKRKKIPILCGGTGFYINALLYDVNFPRTDGTGKNREYYTDIAANYGSNHLHSMLQETDPAAASSIHPNNVKRVIRALCYHRETGLLFSEYNSSQKNRQPVYDTLFCCLNIDRVVLYDRINKRVLNMFDAGLQKEVASLLEAGYNPSLVSMQGIGYKETARYILGEDTLTDAVEAVQQNTRNYAKRQDTWFRNQNPGAYRISVENKQPEEVAMEIDEVRRQMHCSCKT